jgi:UDP-N-acetylglucosamine 2-epimerase (non-hydrolysing)
MSPLVVHLIAAARPNFMKVAPLWHQLKAEPWCRPVMVHTGQHYDPAMSDAFFRDLDLPPPDIHLNIGSGSHAEQTAGVMLAYDRICHAAPPDWVIVVGDVNSTLACALVAVKRGIKVAHLESGLRSRDRAMPEEINRLATDAICDVLWTPSPDADDNLRAEGVPAERVECVGNIMIDSYEMQRERIAARRKAEELGLTPRQYGVLTFHRPVNVDDREQLNLLVEAICAIAPRLPLAFPVHPRTRQRLQGFGLLARLEGLPRLKLTEPMGYIDFMSLVSAARFIVTDSGGVQEETTYLNIPCITVRESTERPITVMQGTNRLVAPSGILAAVDDAMSGNWPHGRRPVLWDGRAAGRVAASLKRRSGLALQESRAAALVDG